MTYAGMLVTEMGLKNEAHVATVAKISQDYELETAQESRRSWTKYTPTQAGRMYSASYNQASGGTLTDEVACHFGVMLQAALRKVDGER